jgi:hypothetical protein
MESSTSTQSQIYFKNAFLKGDLLISTEASNVCYDKRMGAPRKADWREERRKRAWQLKEQGWQQMQEAKR